MIQDACTTPHAEHTLCRTQHEVGVGHYPVVWLHIQEQWWDHGYGFLPSDAAGCILPLHLQKRHMLHAAAMRSHSQML